MPEHDKAKKDFKSEYQRTTCLSDKHIVTSGVATSPTEAILAQTNPITKTEVKDAAALKIDALEFALTFAKSYYSPSEMNHPTMICTTSLIDSELACFSDLSLAVKAYPRVNPETNFEVLTIYSKFASKFHIDKFPGILRQIYTDIWISEQLIEID